MNKRFYVISALAGSLILVLYFLFSHQHVVQLYDSFRCFTDLRYPERIAKEWQGKSSDFLYFQLKMPNSAERKAVVLSILSDRRDRRILPVLKSILQKENTDLNYPAVMCLIKYGQKEAVPTLMGVVSKYNDLTFHGDDKTTWREYDLFSEALRGLAMLRYEPAYLIITKLAKNGTRLEKQLVFNGLLCRYSDHWKEILPLYRKALLDENLTISVDFLKELGRPEAIPILEEYAKAKPLFRDNAEDAIKYLKSLEIKKEVSLE